MHYQQLKLSSNVQCNIARQTILSAGVAVMHAITKGAYAKPVVIGAVNKVLETLLGEVEGQTDNIVMLARGAT